MGQKYNDPPWNMCLNINDPAPASHNNIPSPDNVTISGVMPVHTSVFQFHHTQTDDIQI